MVIKWIKEKQFTNFGLIETGEEIDTKKKNIPDEVAEKWIDTGFAEEIKPSKSTKKEVKQSG